MPQIPFFFDDKETALRKTMNLSLQMNCDIEDSEKMLACLKTKSTEEFKKFAKIPNSENIMFRKSFLPMFGDEVLPIDAILFKNYHNRVDLIYGATYDEGSMFALIYFPELMNDKNTFTMEKIHEMISGMMSQMKVKKSDKIIDYYTKTLNVSNINEVR